MKLLLQKQIIYLKKIIVDHYLACILAVIVGVILVTPLLIFRFDSVYQGIDFFGTDGETSYIAQVHAVYNGDFSFGNVFLYEYKDQPYIKQPLPAIITAGLGKMFGLDVPNAVILAKFIFPVITFLLVYAFCFVLVKRKWIALLGSSFVLLSPATTALLDPSAWTSIFSSGVFVGSDPQFLSYSRPINPQVSNLLFFAYLLTLWKFFESNKDFSTNSKYILGILSCVLLGLSFYTYVFAFSLLFVMNGFLWFYFLIRKDFVKLKHITFITVGAFIVGIPYILNMWGVFNSPYYADLSIRAGQLNTKELVLSRVWFGVVAVYLFFYRKVNAFGIFTITFLAAIFAVSNQQFLTGKTVPIPEHYHWYYMAPLTGLILLHIGFSWAEGKIKAGYLKAIKIALLIVFVIVAILFQRWSYIEQKDTFIELNRYGTTMHWLRDNTTKHDVIFSNESFAELAVVYTPANVYYNSYAGDALLPAERLRHTYYVYMYLNSVPADSAEEYFSDTANKAQFSNRIFSNYWRAKCGSYECYPNELNDQFILEYQEFAEKPFLENLKKYRVTHVVWDKSKNPAWNLDNHFNVSLFEDEGIAVYDADESL